MKKIIIILLFAISPICIAQQRGEVVDFVKQTHETKKSGKAIVLVWDGKKAVKVTIPNQYLRGVDIGEIFPYKIVRDDKTKEYVSRGRRGL